MPLIIADEKSSRNVLLIVSSSINSAIQSSGLLIKAHINEASAVELSPVTAEITEYSISAYPVVGYFKMSAELVYKEIAEAT